MDPSASKSIHQIQTDPMYLTEWTLRTKLVFIVVKLHVYYKPSESFDTMMIHENLK